MSFIITIVHILKKSFLLASGVVFLFLVFGLQTPSASAAALCVTNPELGKCTVNLSVTPVSTTIPSGGNTDVILKAFPILQYDVYLTDFYAYMIEDGTGIFTELYADYSGIYGVTRTTNTGPLTKSVMVYLYGANTQGMESTVSAHITVTSPVVNGSCNATHYNCNAGTLGVTADYPNNSWQWWCNGSGGGTNILCVESKNCGAYAGTDSLTSTCVYNLNAPVTASGGSYTTTSVASPAGYTGSRTWNCSNKVWSPGAYTCTPPAPVNGSCNATHYNCNAGALGVTANYATNWQWWCNGSNGGSNILCSETKPIPVTTFTGTPTTLPFGGGNVTFNWSITNPAGGGSCTAYGGSFAGGKATSGSQVVSVPVSTTFDLDCWNGNGTAAARKSVAITVTASTTINGVCSATPETCATGAYSNSPADNATNMQWTCLGTGIPIGTNSGTCTSPQPIPVTTFTGTPTTLPFGGGNVTFNWSITNPAGGGSCTAYGGSFAGGKATSGSQVVSVPVSTTFDLDCWNGNGTAAARKSVAITVTASTTVNGVCSATPETCATGTYSNSPADNATNKQWTCLGAGIPVGADSPTCTSPQPIPVTTFTGTPTTLPFGGGNVTFNWSITNPAGGGSCTAYGGSFAGGKATSGSQVVSVPVSTTFDLDCWNGNGTAAARKSVAITVAVPPADPTLSFSASPLVALSSVGTSTLSWSTTNATSCWASNGWTGWQALPGGTSPQTIPSTKTFTLECWNSIGVSTGPQSVTVSFYTCGGSFPPNATTYNNDTADLTVPASYSHTLTDSSAKCEYRCDGGFTWNSTSSSCVAVCVPNGCESSTCSNKTCNNTCNPASPGTKSCVVGSYGWIEVAP